MEKQAIIDILGKRRAATFCRVTVLRDAEVLVSSGFKAGEIKKRTAYRFQLTPYANRSPVKEAVRLGKREAPELPAWIKEGEYFPNGLKFWHGFNGEVYLALPVFGDSATFETIWLKRGKEVPYDSVERFLAASEKREIARAIGEKEIREANGQAVARGVKLANVFEVKGE